MNERSGRVLRLLVYLLSISFLLSSYLPTIFATQGSSFSYTRDLGNQFEVQSRIIPPLLYEMTSQPAKVIIVEGLSQEKLAPEFSGFGLPVEIEQSLGAAVDKLSHSSEGYSALLIIDDGSDVQLGTDFELHLARILDWVGRGNILIASSLSLLESSSFKSVVGATSLLPHGQTGTVRLVDKLPLRAGLERLYIEYEGWSEGMELNLNEAKRTEVWAYFASQGNLTGDPAIAKTDYQDGLIVTLGFGISPATSATANGGWKIVNQLVQTYGALSAFASTPSARIEDADSPTVNLPNGHPLVVRASDAANYLVGKGFSVSFSNIASRDTTGRYFIGLHVYGHLALFSQMLNAKLGRGIAGGGSSATNAWRIMATPGFPSELGLLGLKMTFGTEMIPFSLWPPPKPSYFHLAPIAGGISDMNASSSVDNILNGTRVRQNFGYNGTGMKIVVIDSGFNITSHPYYQHYFPELAYNSSGRLHLLSVNPLAEPPANDSEGHGTGVVANLITMAPGANFYFIRAGLPAVEFDQALQKAITIAPDVLSFSEGAEEDCVSNSSCFSSELKSSIYNDVLTNINQGAFTVGAAGNGFVDNTVPPCLEIEHKCVRPAKAWPSSIPQVADIGGGYWNGSGDTASSYASSFQSLLYPTRPHIPDLTGLVGLLVNWGTSRERDGVYIELPTEDNSDIDQSLASQDGTSSSDGWIVASGTSSAAPQVAGVGALIKQITNRLATPTEIKQRLQSTAFDIIAGNSANCDRFTGVCDTAGPGFDNATGAGLVDAWRAITQKQSFTVTVVDAVSGLPLSGASVTGTYFNGTVLLRGTTDSNGRVTFFAPVGGYSLAVSASAYTSQTVATYFLSDKSLTVGLPFSLTAASYSLSIFPSYDSGGYESTTLKVTATATGTPPYYVTLTWSSGNPGPVSVAISPTQVTPTSSGGTSTITFSVGAGQIFRYSRTYYFVVTASKGSISQSITIAVTVQQNCFCIPG